MNALTIDVEDYFQVSAFEGYVDRSQWDGYPLRVRDNTMRVLDLLDEHGVAGTFFILGWVARRCPTLVGEIARRGHEIASHGYGHELVYHIGPARFRNDVRKAKTLLEDLSGARVRGYRAPSYSVTARSLWALDVLIEEGFDYDSSIFPIHHDIYGIPHARRFPHLMKCESGDIVEFPLTTYPLRFGKKEFRFPIAGGGYLRLLPAKWLAAGFKSINENEGEPAVLYFHPWEVDPDQPRIEAALKSRLRHYLNLEKTEGKLRHLLRTLPFCCMRDVLNRSSHLLASPEPEAVAVGGGA